MPGQAIWPEMPSILYYGIILPHGQSDPVTQIPPNSPVLAQQQDGVLTLTLNRPESRNPLSQVMIGALQQALDEAAESPATRVVIIAATGSVFSAGHDLKEMTAYRSESDHGLS